MSDHLPECGVTRYPICICDRLRACEQRVINEQSLLVIKAYLAGLAAARDAVAAIEGDNPGLLPRWVKREALTAIDGLRQTVDVPPNDPQTEAR